MYLKIIFFIPGTGVAYLCGNNIYKHEYALHTSYNLLKQKVATRPTENILYIIIEGKAFTRKTLNQLFEITVIQYISCYINRILNLSV